MLLADDQQNASGSGIIVIVVGLVVTALTSFGTAVMSYLSARSKQSFDSEFNLLKKSHSECEAEHRETQSRLLAVNERCEKAEHNAFKMEGELAGANRELVSLRVDVNELRTLLYKRTGGGA